MEKIAIIGAGLIGRAWAMVFARAGHSVNVWDSDAGAVTRALGLIETALGELRDAKLIDEDPKTVRARVSGCATLAEALRDVDYVQENTSERVDIKKKVYADLDAAAKPDCILASSTSTIPTSVFSEGLKGKQRCIVAHPVNPPHVVPIVELSPAPWTSADVVERAYALQEKVGQVPIIVKKEIEGFILNRLQAALLHEAWRLVKDDYVTVDDLDKCIKDGLGLRWSFMGPFETIDLNAPGGVPDYAERYGSVLYEMMKDVRYEQWDDALIEKITAERRKAMPQEEHGEREAWRDRRLMALMAHKRALAAQGHR
ncbi:MAG: 3-hydroxyacyl-CoA dehydrogenase [Betaproteobacteria bacterium]